VTVDGLPARQVGATRWEMSADGIWSTASETERWWLEYRPKATPPLVAGWTLRRLPHLVLQEPLYRADDLVRALRWATGYVSAGRATAAAAREAGVSSDVCKDRNVRST
jgi:hypothetical protein